MAAVILYAPEAESEAESLARACERRGVFIELETGQKPGRPWRPEDVCVALLTRHWAEPPARGSHRGAVRAAPRTADVKAASARLRRAFDAVVDARLLVAPLAGALTPFGWRDQPVGAPPWAQVADRLLDFGPVAQPAMAPATSPPKPNGRSVLVLASRTAGPEAADLARALKHQGFGVDIAGPEVGGARMRGALAEADAAALLLNAEAGQSDGMRRWLHLLHRERVPHVLASVDSLWRQAPLSEHLGRARRVDLGRLPGEERGARLAKAIAALPRKPKPRRRA